MSGRKLELFAAGFLHVTQFCGINDLEIPEIQVRDPDDWLVGACAYYRPTYIAICLERCASIGFAGPAWSYPGYTVDRTPYGVLAHEIGHHADVSRSPDRKGRYMGDFSIATRMASAEERLTEYCPNDGEWFAEMFRLFITNPDLLRLLRPKTYAILCDYFKPSEPRTWRQVLSNAPSRTVYAAEKKILTVSNAK